MANRANFDYYWQEFKQLEKTINKSTNFFAVSEYKLPTFLSMQSEVELLDSIGKISDNSDFSMPLVVFNTYDLQNCFNYFEKLRSFEKLPLVDDESLAKNEVPHYFQTVYIPDDKFLIVGGLERESAISSARCFMIDDKGKLSVTTDMNVARQYITLCSAEDLIYAIGGFNSQDGVLGSFEVFNTRARKWTLFGENAVDKS